MTAAGSQPSGHQAGREPMGVGFGCFSQRLGPGLIADGIEESSGESKSKQPSENTIPGREP